MIIYKKQNKGFSRYCSAGGTIPRKEGKLKMKYITTKEAADNWNISEGRIRKLARGARIPDAIKIGTSWNIPENASKPIDRRIKNEQDFEINIKEDVLEKIYKNRTITNKVSKREILKWIYNSNAIEGNTLTFYETQKILKGTAIGGKTIKEHLEVINHKDAIAFIEELAQREKILTEENIKNINEILLRGIDNENSGKYKDQQDISSQMEQLLMDYEEWGEDYLPIEDIALLYGEFLKISPFVAANGATARLLINLENIRNGDPLIIIKNNKKRQHDRALETAHSTGDYTELVKLIMEMYK